MASGAFSRVNVQELESDDEDEDVRRRALEDGKGKYAAAEAAYTAKGSKEEVLRLFEQAEAAMKPVLSGGGLTSLNAQEIEKVLKGRLHQAVILAHLEHIPDRWPKVKSLAEDVLQFDFGNAHARWLRALSLGELAGGSASLLSEAKEEMLRAIQCARSAGKAGEAEQWERELARITAAVEAAGGGPPGGSTAASAPPPGVGGAPSAADAADGHSLPARAPAKPAGAAASASGFAQSVGDAAAAKGQDRKPVAFQKGFFNRAPGGKKAPAVATAPASISGASVEGGSSASAAASTASVARQSAEAKAEVDEAHALLREQRRLLDERSEELARLRRQLDEERGRHEDARDDAERWRHVVADGLRELGADFEEALANEASATAAVSAAADGARGTAEAVAEAQQAARTWAEAQHQRYLDASTEVLTLRTMLNQEHRERQDAARARVDELRELARRLGDLRVAARTLRDSVRQRVAGAPPADGEEPEMLRVAETVAEFRALSFSQKMSALTDDATVLKLAILVCALGMLLTLGAFVEGFGRFGCRFVCVR